MVEKGILGKGNSMCKDPEAGGKEYSRSKSLKKASTVSGRPKKGQGDSHSHYCETLEARGSLAFPTVSPDIRKDLETDGITGFLLYAVHRTLPPENKNLIKKFAYNNI